MVVSRVNRRSKLKTCNFPKLKIPPAATAKIANGPASNGYSDSHATRNGSVLDDGTKKEN